MINDKYILSVYNFQTREIGKIEVSEEIYHAYRRTGWKIENNDKSFYRHEIQMSALSGGEDGSFENFREFISEEANPENLVERKMLLSALYKALDSLSEPEKKLIQAIYFQGMTEQQYADQVDVAQQVINRKKQRVLEKLKKLLSKQV